MREPFFFGAGGGLFGVVERPDPRKKRSCGVVICGSVGQEYIRSHRAIRELAKRLGSEGFPVLRFDYRGCGDSLGECDEFRLNDWREDVAAAIQRMQSRFRPRQICVIGFRLGGSLALGLDLGRAGCDRLLLWEPVIQGTRLLDEFRELHRQHVAEWQPSLESARRASGSNHRPGMMEALGFEFSEEMQQEIGAIDLLRFEGRLPDDVLLIENVASEAGRRLGERLGGAASKFGHARVEEAPVWLSEPFQSVVPQATVDVVLRWLLGERGPS